jgi:hypothetical protein
MSLDWINAADHWKHAPQANRSQPFNRRENMSHLQERINASVQERNQEEMNLFFGFAILGVVASATLLFTGLSMI